MDILLELIVEFFVELITDNGVDVMTGSDRTSHLSKGVKIVLVIVTILIFVGIIGSLLFFGINSLINGEIALGILLALSGAALLIFIVTSFIKELRKNLAMRKDRRN